MSDELERLDRLLDELGRVLEAPGDDGNVSPEWTWQRFDLPESSMGSEALRAMLRRQGMRHARIDEAFDVLTQRRSARAQRS